MSYSTYISDEPIIQYQHYLLLLKELEKDIHEEEYIAFIKSLLKENDTLDNLDAPAEDLAKIDIALANAQIKKLHAIAPNTVEAVSQQIMQFDSKEPLEKAGFDVLNEESYLPMSFPQDISIIMAYESEFPDDKMTPLSERLSNFKNTVASAAGTDNAKLFIAAGMYSIAIGSGAGLIALPVATAMFATKLMENKKVQDLMTGLHNKVSNTMVKLGFKSENVESRSSSIGEKMKDVTESKWYKAAKVPLVCCTLLLGVGALTVSMADINPADMKDAVASIMSSASDSAHELGSIAADTASSAAAAVKDGASAVLSDPTGSLVAVAEGVAAISKDTMDNLASVGFLPAEMASNIVHGFSDLAEYGSNLRYEDFSNEDVQKIIDANNFVLSTEPMPGLDLNQSLDGPIENEGLMFAQDIVESSINDLRAFDTDDIQSDFSLYVEPIPEIDLALETSVVNEEIQISTAQGVIENPISDLGSLNIEADMNSKIDRDILEMTGCAAPEATSYVAEKNDNLWKIASEHYKNTVGSEASPQQIVAMINDLNLDNPNNIQIGQEFSFPSDLSKYSDVTSVSADWLGDSPEEVIANVESEKLVAGNIEAVNITSPSEINADAIATMQKIMQKTEIDDVPSISI